MKLLNLDELAVIKRRVTFAGTDYDIAEQTVGQMLSAFDLIEEGEKMESTGDAEVDATRRVFMQMVDTASRVLPTCPKEVLEAMNFKQLSSLLEFAAASDEDAEKVGEKQEGDSEGKEQP